MSSRDVSYRWRKAGRSWIRRIREAAGVDSAGSLEELVSAVSARQAHGVRPLGRGSGRERGCRR